MEILDCKAVINDKINAILNEYQNLEKKHSQENKLFSEEVERLNQLNSRFSHELTEKDKLLTCKEKTICDYENMIKELQVQKKEEGKFDMIRGQDQEIKNLIDKLSKKNNEIERLNSKFHLLEEKNNSFIEMKVEEVDEVEVEVEDEVEEVDEVEDKEVDEVEDKDKEVDEVEDKEVEDNESLDEEPLNVEVITHYKKSYYVIEHEVPQYIYNIDDDEGLGEKVGVIEKGKKKFYKK